MTSLVLRVCRLPSAAPVSRVAAPLPARLSFPAAHPRTTFPRTSFPRGLSTETLFRSRPVPRPFRAVPCIPTPTVRTEHGGLKVAPTGGTHLAGCPPPGLLQAPLSEPVGFHALTQLPKFPDAPRRLFTVQNPPTPLETRLPPPLPPPHHPRPPLRRWSWESEAMFRRRVAFVDGLRRMPTWQKVLVMLVVLFVLGYVMPFGFLLAFGLAGAGSAMVFFGGLFVIVAPVLLVLTGVYALLAELGIAGPAFGVLPWPIMPFGVQKAIMTQIEADPSVCRALGQPLYIDSIESYREMQLVANGKPERRLELDARVCGPKGCGVVEGAFRKVGFGSWQPIRVITLVDTSELRQNDEPARRQRIPIQH
eukprot:TRINITY_DN3298_c0_g1_i2.p3 TRINITY_DN3298_c0_g1~~TRINITY_DN3298_c0_g1_i2.p3  ORF type:complete len:364 (-),score=114.93 TRINITY_DN3298_c0_g1_i2:175-1266(-)